MRSSASAGARRASAGLVAGVDALRDVRRLRAQRHADAAGRAVEALARGVVPDAQHRLADDVGDVHVPGGGDLPGDVDLTGGDEGLDGHPATGVLLEHRVQDRVADLVGDLVGVALGHRLGGEETAWHSDLPAVGCRTRSSRPVVGGPGGPGYRRPAPGVRRGSPPVDSPVSAAPGGRRSRRPRCPRRRRPCGRAAAGWCCRRRPAR